MKQKGQLIVIEGTDGSGKGTQAKKLVSRLQDMGKRVLLMSYPVYDSFTGQIVADYLNGNLGTFKDIHPKLASLAFALDRFASKNYIQTHLNQGYTVVCDRYVESNIVYQSSKLDVEKRDEFKSWLLELEYSVLKLPVPDKIIFLDVPPSISRQLVLKKDARSYTDKKEDLHEAQHSYLEEVYTVFRDVMSASSNWVTVNCITTFNELKTINEISDEIMELLYLNDTVPKIFVDMDGPLVNFEKYVAERASTGDKIKTIPGAYLEMEPEAGGLEAVRSLIGMGYDVWIATKPPTGVPHAYSDKVSWILKHLPQLKRKIIVTHDKGLLGGPRDYLIDDRPHKANCETFAGTLLVYKPELWTWPDLLRYFRERRPNKRGQQ